MEPHNLTGLRTIAESVLASSPMVAALSVARRRDGDDIGLIKQIAIAMIIPMLTAGMTAYITQAVMAEQIKSLKEEVRYNRDYTQAEMQKMALQIQTNRDDMLRSVRR